MGPLRQLRVHRLRCAANEPEGIRQVLEDAGTLRVGMRLCGTGVEVLITACEPEAGQYDTKRTEVTLADQQLAVFDKVHVLPYKDTFQYNFEHMYHNHLVPYFDSKQCGEFSKGFDFSYSGARFNVIGTEPVDLWGVVGSSTVVFYEGPLLERKVLDKLHLVPYEDGLPERYRPTRLSLDEAALLRDYIRPHFERRSAEVAIGEVVEVDGVRFKVIACTPSTGGGVGRDTELLCRGVALKPASSVQQSAKAKGRPKPKASPASVMEAMAARRAAASGQAAEAAGPSSEATPLRSEGGGGDTGGSSCVIA